MEDSPEWVGSVDSSRWDHLIDEIKEHARRDYPRESCGMIVDNKYIPVENVSNRPLDSFAMPKNIVSEAVISGKLEAIVHSHPDADAEPTSVDMESQMRMAIPFGVLSVEPRRMSEIVWFGDQLMIPSLLDRPFIHGVYDCYSACRHYLYAEFGIFVPDYPRDNRWWEGKKPKDLYQQNFIDMGFKEISLNEVEPGDIIFFSIFSKVINHAAAYIGNNQIYHHLMGRISRREASGSWNRFVSKVIRYERSLTDEESVL